MKPYVLDFETYYDTEYTLKKMTTDEYIHDARFKVHGVGIRYPNSGVTWWHRDWQVEQALAEIPWGEAALICHNSAFDGAILAAHYGHKPKLHVDTLSMARAIVGPHMRNDLDTLAQHFQLGKKTSERLLDVRGVRTLTDEQSKSLGEYCCNDVDLTWALFQVLRVGFPASEMKIIDFHIRMYTEPVLELDLPMLEKAHKEKEDRKRKLLTQLGIELTDLRSDPKFAELLQKLGIDPPQKPSPKRKDENGRPVMAFAFAKSDEGMKSLLDHEDDDVALLAEARVECKSTIDESRLSRLIKIAKDGRPWPIMLNYYGAHTGRPTGGDKLNPLNLRKGSAMRDAVMAPPGCVLVVGDSSQIEARFTALVAGQNDLVEDFRAGVDIYSTFASTAYGYAIDKKNNPNERFVGKTCILGLGYGMGPPKLRTTLKRGIPGVISVDATLDQCEAWVALYRSRYSRIRALWKTMENVLAQIASGEEADYGYFQVSRAGIHLPNGLMLQYPGLHYSEKGWAYYNRGKLTHLWGGKVTENLIQALAYLAVKRMQLRLWLMGYKIPLEVYDEIIKVVPEEDADKAKADMIAVMSTPPSFAPDLPVACEVEVGRRYGDCK